MGHPIAPTEFFKGWSAPETRSAGYRSPQPRDCDIQPSKGGHRAPITSDQLVDGYRRRLAPRNLHGIVATGQSSTDLIPTERTAACRGFGRGHPGGIARRATTWAGTRY